VAQQAHRRGRRYRRRADGEVLRRPCVDHARRVDRRDPQGDDPDDARADALRLVVPQQGRAETARLHHRVPAVAAGSACRHGYQPQDRRGGCPPRFGGRSVLRSGVQDRYRPLRGPSGVRARLFGKTGCRFLRARHAQRQARAYQPYLPDALQQAEPDRDGRCGRHLRRRRFQGDPHGRYALRRESCSNR